MIITETFIDEATPLSIIEVQNLQTSLKNFSAKSSFRNFVMVCKIYVLFLSKNKININI